MFAKLKGIIDTLGTDEMILDVGGVGYRVYCSATTLQSFSTGDACSVHIEPHIREDHFDLYGFSTQEEHNLFCILTKVSGVGSKMALALLGTHPPAQLAQAITNNDRTLLTQAPGVGPKLATRIITELKDKIAKLGYASSITTAVTGGVSQIHDPRSQDAVAALVQLGYHRQKATAMVEQTLQAHPDIALDDLIRLSLKSFMPV